MFDVLCVCERLIVMGNALASLKAVMVMMSLCKRRCHGRRPRVDWHRMYKPPHGSRRHVVVTMLLCGYVAAKGEARRRVMTGGKSTPSTARQLYFHVMLRMLVPLTTE